MNIIRKLYKKTVAIRWNLGFIESDLGDIVEGKDYNVRYLKHNYNDRWFADPWLLSVDDNTIKVLVEEKKYGENQKGYISLMTVDRENYQLIDLKTALRLPSHLSFPAILRENGKVYIYPENAEGEGLALYELQDEKFCSFVHNLSKDPLADAVITDCLGERLMFSTSLPEQNGSLISIHQIDTEKGISHKIGEYLFESNIARNAGDWFEIDNRVYRPAQDCNGGYGKAVIIQKVDRNSKGEISFTDVRRLTSSHHHLDLGMHTFNSLNGLTVIDVYGYRYPKWVAQAGTFIFDMLRFVAGRK